MLTTNYGDLARSVLLRQQIGQASSRLDALAAEVASGRKSDLQTHLGGDFTALAGLERALARGAALEQANSDAAQFAAAQQSALGTIHDLLTGAGPTLINAGARGEATQIDANSRVAARQLDQVIASLNTRYGARALFAGADTRAAALADTETLLADLGAALSTQTTAAGVLAAADAWFAAPGGGFETQAYRGSMTQLAPFQIAEGTNEVLDVTAADPTLRDVVKHFALAALVGRGLLAGAPGEQAALIEAAGAGMMTAANGVTALRTGIGFAEERIADAAVRMGAERTGLEAARSALIGADPYETTLHLQETETQLSLIYTLTARLSQLSLAAVLR